MSVIWPVVWLYWPLEPSENVTVVMTGAPEFPLPDVFGVFGAFEDPAPGLGFAPVPPPPLPGFGVSLPVAGVCVPVVGGLVTEGVTGVVPVGVAAVAAALYAFTLLPVAARDEALETRSAG